MFLSNRSLFYLGSVQTIADFSDFRTTSEWMTSTDEQIGGFSKASLSHDNHEGCATFSGVLSTKLPLGLSTSRGKEAGLAGGPQQQVAQSGYAVSRTKPLVPTLFGESFHDLSAFNGVELV